ncbi:MAG TPA: sigma-70 family RNA polymerase sigma factor [Methylovorus sp.]|jgi:RNA polymerase sigma factor (sigma-70 family)|nr:sigma-70 family RNA polymerase sigma factor [Methylovorus sp.]
MLTPQLHLRNQWLSLLYRHHQGWLMGWLRKKLGCPHHAADISHDTFSRLLTLDNIPDIHEPRAYLLVTANRLMINEFHKRQVEQETLQAVALLNADDSSHSPETICSARQLLAQVVWMLSEELDEKAQRALLLARVDGLSYREIAAAMQVSESSVKQYLSRALVHCHARLYPGTV